MNNLRRRKRILAISAAAYIILTDAEERKVWVKNWRKDRSKYGHMNLIRELRDNDPDDYRNYLRMDSESFDYLLDLVTPYIRKQDTNMRDSISCEERLAATLRYLATGRTLKDLTYSTSIAQPTLSFIIPETCRAIFSALKKEVLKFPTTKEEWQEIAIGFEERWEFINCGGALDGKHVAIKSPPNSGAHYYNYKGFYSIILMALVNANYEFIFVDVGKNGRMSDGGVIEYTEFHRRLTQGLLKIPTNSETVGNLNYVFIADEAFALHEHVLRPYPERELTDNKRIYNYRLSRARNCVENAFGLISSRFRILQCDITLSPDSATDVVLAICVLHNYLRKKSSSYCNNMTFDRIDKNTGEIVKNGEWRKNTVEMTSLQRHNRGNATVDAKINRDKYLDFFNSEGSVIWQENVIKKGKC